MNKVIVGIDISKKTFDAAFKAASKWKHSKFANTPKGFEELVDWLHEHELKSVHIVMESTGRYGFDLCYFCNINKLDISVVNPAAIKFYGMSKLSRTKTDKADARLIAEFGMQSELKLWEPKIPSIHKLQNLDRALKKLKTIRAQLKNGIEGSIDKDVIKTYQDLISNMDEQIKAFEKKTIEVIKKDEQLHLDYQNLQTIPGVAAKTAMSLMAEIPDIEQFESAKQLVAYAGLNPSIRQSGTSVKGKSSISKKGSKQLRNSLYYPGLTAKRHNKKLRDFVVNLEKKGKKPKEIIVACKLLETVYWVLRKRVAYAY